MNDTRSLTKKFKSLTKFKDQRTVSLEKSEIKAIVFSTPRLPKVNRNLLSPKFGSRRRMIKKEDYFRLSVLGPLPPLSLKSKFRGCICESPIKQTEDDIGLLDDIEQLLKEVN